MNRFRWSHGVRRTSYNCRMAGLGTLLGSACIVSTGLAAPVVPAAAPAVRAPEVQPDEANRDLKPAETAPGEARPGEAAPDAKLGGLGDMSLEDLMKVQVSTVSRVDERIDQTPGSIYLFARSMIQQRGYRSLGDLLQTVPGFTVFHRDLDFVAGVRGLNANDNEKISLLINGQLVLGLHEPDFLNGPINLDTVERVEVVVGPSSFFQQANTLAATINVITRQLDGKEAMVSVGNDLPYSATLMAGKRRSPEKYVGFSLTTEAKQGFDAWNDDFRSNLAGRKLTGKLEWPNYFSVLQKQRGGWNAQAIAYRSKWPELHIENGSLNNHGHMVEQFYSVFLKNEHALTPALTRVLRLDAALKEQTRANQGGPPLDAVQQFVKQRNYNAELGLRYTGLARHLVQAGIQGSYDDNVDISFSFLAPGQPGFIPKTPLVDKNTHAVGFYVDDTFQANERLKLIGGVRLDRNTRLRGNRWFAGGRATAIYQPRANWVSKLIYNRAVRMPSPLAALNQVWGSDHLNNPNNPPFAHISPQPQNPEVLSTVEWQNIFYLSRVRLGTTIYHQQLDDFITWFSPHTNVGDFNGPGAEVNVQAPLNPTLTLWANGSWNDSKLRLFRQPLDASGGVESHHAYTNPEGRIIGSAQFMANLGFDYKLRANLTLSPGMRYFTNQAALDFAPNNQSVYTTIRNRYYVDGALTWRNAWGKDMDLRLSARNLFGNRRPIASQLNADSYRPRGREFVVSLDRRF